MISQKQMKEWIPEAVERFKDVMPEINVPYPEFHIASKATAEKKRADVVKTVQSPQIHVGKPAKAEMIHGDVGDAIIIYQQYIRENPYSRTEEKSDFLHIIWHELGHFYATYTECPGTEFYRYMDQQPREGNEAAKQIAYWVWTEFIAEVIACHIDPDEDIDWEKYNWYPIKNELIYLLEDVFESEPDSIDEYTLGQYFAKLLADKKTVGFVTAADSGKAKFYESFVGTRSKTFKEAGVDPTGMHTIDDAYRDLMRDLITILKEQLSKDRYWEMDDDLLFDIHSVIAEMTLIKYQSVHGSFGDLLRSLTQ